MAARAHPLFLWIFLLVLAPVGAAVVVTVLLLWGVEPRLVFAPGRAVQSLFELCGLHPANRVAVASTVGVFWAAIAAVGLAWERRRSAA
jgi:hypothetical protein